MAQLDPDDSTLLSLPDVLKPGVSRDQTKLDTQTYDEMVWARIRNGRPRKIGGYREVINGLDGPVRLTYTVSQPPLNAINCFSYNGLQVVTTDADCLGANLSTRAITGFTPQNDYTWQADTLWDSGGSGEGVLIAHPGRNLNLVDNNINTDVYYGNAADLSSMVAIGAPVQVSGGVVVLGPYLFAYGNDGLIMNSDTNSPTNFASGDANAANIGASKIVQGLPIRGGGNPPAGLFWSLDSVIRVSYVGGAALFNYDTISEDSSILSPGSCIEYAGNIYWAAMDRFLAYTGTVQEVPNSYNQDFFFDNLNWTYRSKVFAMKFPRWGEIWWFFPYGTATECNWAVIFNVREQCWYDTPLTRSAGAPVDIVRYPIMPDSMSNADTGTPGLYRLWQQEFGWDRIVGQQQTALTSSFTTSSIGIAGGGLGNQGLSGNVNTQLTRIEPDFTQVGEMTVQAMGSPYPQGAATETGGSASGTFGPDTPYVDLKIQSRLPKLKFTSNVQGGMYQMGKPQIHAARGDPRPA